MQWQELIQGPVVAIPVGNRFHNLFLFFFGIALDLFFLDFSCLIQTCFLFMASVQLMKRLQLWVFAWFPWLHCFPWNFPFTLISVVNSMIVIHLHDFFAYSKQCGGIHTLRVSSYELIGKALWKSISTRISL
jgi:hypothetical protein